MMHLAKNKIITIQNKTVTNMNRYLYVLYNIFIQNQKSDKLYNKTKKN